MSIRVMSLVWEHSRHSGTDLLMLLALADFSDDQGNSYPAVSTLAARCRMRARNANYILKVLQDSGELQVRPNEGPRGTNRYRIVLEVLRGVQELAGVGVQSVAGVGVQAVAGVQSVAGLQSSVGTPAIQRRLPLQPIADEPSLNRQEPKKTRARRAPRASDRSTLLPDVHPQVLADWEQVRKAKRAGAVTATVVKSLRSEASKAGLSLQRVIEICCARGWQSFKASWVHDDQGSAGARRPGVLHADDVFEGVQ